MSKKAKLSIKEYDVDSLIEMSADYNPRTIDDEQKAGLNSSLNKFGYVNNIIFNKRTKTVVSGHQRLKALKKQGFEKVDVNVVDLSLEDEKALNVAMNATTITGDFTHTINDLLDEIMENDTEFYDMANLGLLNIFEEEVEQEDTINSTDSVDIPEMDLMAYEHYDCVLVVFKNVDDFMYLSSKLGLNEKRVISAPMVKHKKIGKVRAVSADKILNLINDNEEPSSFID